MDSGAIIAGAVTTAALLFHRLFNPIGALVGMVDQVQSAGASLVRMVGVITMPVPERTATLHSTAAGPGPLELTGVTHTYGEGAPALIDVDLTVAPGEVVAVVGSTGAGKSTLALVAAGSVVPTRGSARLGGVPLTDVDPVALRQHVTMGRPGPRPVSPRCAPRWRPSVPIGSTTCPTASTPSSVRADMRSTPCRVR